MINGKKINYTGEIKIKPKEEFNICCVELKAGNLTYNAKETNLIWFLNDKNIYTAKLIFSSKDDIDFVREDIVKKYGFTKVTSIVEGGAERYDSVYNGLKVCGGYICLIHDSARAMINVELINRCIEETFKYRAVEPTVAPKDTIRIRDGEFGGETIDRNTLCIIQTPQCFDIALIKSAFEGLYKTDYKTLGITDDAMVVEKFSDTKVRLIEGDYKNIKVTTPEDIVIAKAFLDAGNC